MTAYKEATTMTTQACPRPQDAHAEATELTHLLDALLNLSADAEQRTLSGQDVYALLQPVKAKADRVLSALS